LEPLRDAALAPAPTMVLKMVRNCKNYTKCNSLQYNSFS
jgi:hypothetical protein